MNTIKKVGKWICGGFVIAIVLCTIFIAGYILATSISLLVIFSIILCILISIVFYEGVEQLIEWMNNL